MKKKIKNIIKTIIFLIALLFFINCSSYILRDKPSIKRYYDFYNDNTELDILLSGSSHMLNSILPMELYEKYGITSYNIGNPRESIPTSYWVIRNAIKQRKPKIVILEVYYDGWGEKIKEDDMPFLHYFFDSAPFSIDKFLAMNDLVGLDKSLEYLFDLSFYNSRWDKLTEDDFNFDYSLEKGALSLIEYKSFDYVYDDTSCNDERLKVTDVAEEYLNKIKELCEKNDIKLILFQSPFPANNNEIETSIKYNNYAKENNIPFINLLKQNEIDYSVYMANRGHLNIYGAKIITNMVGEYLLNNYSNIISSKNIEKWNNDLVSYEKSNELLLKSTMKIDEIILLSLYLNYDIEIKINNEEIKNVDIIRNYMDKNIIKKSSNTCDYNICMYIYKNDLLIKEYDDLNNGIFNK